MFSQFTACSMLTVSTNMGIQAIGEKWQVTPFQTPLDFRGLVEPVAMP